MQYLFITDSDFANTDSSFQYLLWFQPSLGAMLLSSEKLQIFLDGRYFAKTSDIDKKHIRDRMGNTSLQIEYILIQNISDSLTSYLSYEEDVTFQENIALAYFNTLKEWFESTQIHFERWHFLSARAEKNSEEKQRIQQAIDVIDRVMIDMKHMVDAWEVIWKTEKQLRVIILQKIYEHGWEWESFEAIVAFGKNSAIPHHSPDDTIIENGVLLLDMWAKFQGYCSDCTRCFWVGEKNAHYETFLQVYSVVRSSHLAAYEWYTPGMRADELDALARNVIQDSAYSDLFIHSLWHSLGIDIHEDPRIRDSDTTVLQENMVFTIEPWIYIPGEFWIRLEDIVFLEAGKLTKYTSLEL